MKAKKALVLSGAALVVFYVVTQPVAAAAALNGILGWLKDGGEAIITFVRSLFA